MSDDIIIREGKDDDIEAIAALIVALLKYEGYTAWHDNIESLRANGFGDSSWYHTFVAETTNEQGTSQIVGMTMYYYCYSVIYGRCIHMEALYVNPDYQGKGIGIKLWKAVAQVGVDKGCNLLDIGARETNVRAMNLYKSRGAFDLTDQSGIHLLFMQKEEMHKFANS